MSAKERETAVKIQQAQAKLGEATRARDAKQTEVDKLAADVTTFRQEVQVCETNLKQAEEKAKEKEEQAKKNQKADNEDE